MTDSIVIPSQQQPEDPEYVKKMIEKGTAAVDGQPPQDQPERPAWLPEKFKSVEEMAKAYSELEKKQGEQPKKPEEGEPKKDAEQKPADNLQVEQQVEAKGFKMADLQAEFNQNGALSEETYNKLAEAGFSHEDVDAYIEGRKALVAQVEQKGYELVGGKETYDAMKEWARVNLKPNEIVAFNKAVSDPDTRELAIAGLNAKFQSSEGKERSTNINPNTGKPGASDVYESRAQLVVDMNKPEYRTDPAYRQKVAEKLARSKIF